MAEVEIPGGTARLRSKLVSERQFRIVETAFMAANSAIKKVREAVPESEREDPNALGAAFEKVSLSRQEAAAILDLQDAAIVAFLESWTLPRPLPTMDTVGDLERDLYRALAEATRGLGASAALGHVDFSPQKPGENPTGSSESSGTPSEAGADNPSTPESPVNGESTATASSTTD